MMSNFRWTHRIARGLRTALAAAATLMLAGHAAAADAPQREITILTGSDPYYLPIILAVENGYFQAEGLAVKHRMFPSGTDAMLAFRGIGAEFVASGDAPSLVLWDGGDAVGVAPIYASPENLLGVVHSDIKTPADLKGKKIGVKRGSTADYFLTTYLEKNGLKAADVHILNLSPPECVPAMSSGSVDGFFLWQPYPGLALKVMGSKAHTLTTARGYYMEQIYLTANRKFADEHQEVVTKVLRALDKAIAFVKAQPQKSAEIVARKIKTEPPVVMEVIATKPYTMTYGPANREQLTKLGEFLQANGKLKGGIDLKKVFDDKYLGEADKALVVNR
ncbi:MAG TPA: NrtA/SsuA/CpmA family ABC transporter substrate-binding protein [Usitatibacter sp.]|jgi:ABC-type nitrate/sulfonate/bicarbonate transport system substrate-binding protein|nr:NrtA/SsuA/CpmA family ABC transporter substrate-binding protein [Usitatibacter sp.]